MTYLLHGYQGRIYEEETFGAFYKELIKPGSRLGPFATHVGTGTFNKSVVTIMGKLNGITTRLTADSVKKVIRQLRPQEAEELAEIDEAIKALRERRREVLKKAWARGHVVTVAAVKTKADAALARHEGTEAGNA